MSDQTTILIVDDDESSLRFISLLLEGAGYAYDLASDGNEALESMRERKPALVLLDIWMPKSGILVFEEMKRDAQLQDIPVIFITGASQTTGVDLKTGEEEPITSYSDQYPRAAGSRIHQKLESIEPEGLIEKPIDPAVLLEEIKRVLSQS